MLVSYVLPVLYPLMPSSCYKSTQREKVMSIFFFMPMFTRAYLLNTFWR